MKEANGSVGGTHSSQLLVVDNACFSSATPGSERTDYLFNNLRVGVDLPGYLESGPMFS